MIIKKLNKYLYFNKVKKPNFSTSYTQVFIMFRNSTSFRVCSQVLK